jgi:hypothetical protein
VVAIASREPFGELPWYLRPYDMQAEQVGYDGERDDEEGITAEGRIVGDPFVAMERIRRRVVNDAQDADVFGTSYVTYYVHDQVRYPRYLCYDCHRPGRWSWWADFDPYYTHCSVIDYRVNWGWSWGPRYWFGSVPYYTFIVRSDCPPFYRQHYRSGVRFSSWDGWRRWNSLWGDRLVRYKSAPPRDYVPPSKFSDQRFRTRGAATPPGFIVGDPSGRRSGRLVAGNLDRSDRRSPRDVVRGDGSEGSRRGNGRGTLRPEGGRSVEPRTSPRESRPREERPRLEWPGSRQGDGARDSRRVEPPGSRRDDGARDSRRLELPRSRSLPRQGDGARDSRRLEWPGSRREEPAREARPRAQSPGSRGEERRSERPRFEPPREERRPAERSRSEGTRETPQRVDRPREERGREARPNDSWRAPESGRGHRGRG